MLPFSPTDQLPAASRLLIHFDLARRARYAGSDRVSTAGGFERALRGQVQREEWQACFRCVTERKPLVLVLTRILVVWKTSHASATAPCGACATC